MSPIYGASEIQRMRDLIWRGWVPPDEAARKLLGYRIKSGPWKNYYAHIGASIEPHHHFDIWEIGRTADAMTWPFPTRCCRTRPFDRERDA